MVGSEILNPIPCYLEYQGNTWVHHQPASVASERFLSGEGVIAKSKFPLLIWCNFPLINEYVKEKEKKSTTFQKASWRVINDFKQLNNMPV